MEQKARPEPRISSIISLKEASVFFYRKYPLELNSIAQFSLRSQLVEA